MTAVDASSSKTSRHRMTRAEWSVIATSAAVSGVLLGSSLLGSVLLGVDENSHRWAWTESLLLNLGAAVLLIVPIEWMSSRLRRRVEDVDERQTAAVEQVRETATSSVTELASQVSSLDARVKDLTELSQSVADEAARRAADDERVFGSMSSEVPTSESLHAALSRGRERKLTSERGVRVPVAEVGSLRLRFDAPPAATAPVVTLEDIRGEFRREWTWFAETAATDFWSVVADCLDGEGEHASLDVGFVFASLSQSLLTASREREARPLIELCPPQWAVTDIGIAAVTEWGYTVTHSRPDRVDMDVHVREKTWLDTSSYERAFEIAAYLFPVTEQQWRSAVRRPDTV